MAAPVIGTQSRLPPPKGAVVDRTHPLAQGLGFCFIPAYGNVDLAAGYAGTKSGSPSYAPTAFGQAGRILSASGDYYDFAGVPDDPFLGPITIAWVGRTLSASAFRQIISKLNGAVYTNYPFDLYFNNTAAPQALIWYRANSGGKGWTSTRSIALNTDYVLVGTQVTDIMTAPTCWINGVQQTMTALDAGNWPGASGGSGGSVRVGRRQDGSVVQSDEQVNMVAVWGRMLNTAEVQTFTANPFCFLRY